MAFSGFLWRSLSLSGFPWLSLAVSGFLWFSLPFSGFLCLPDPLQRPPRIPQKMYLEIFGVKIAPRRRFRKENHAFGKGGIEMWISGVPPRGPASQPVSQPTSQSVSHSGSQRASLINLFIRINNDTNGNTPSYNQTKNHALKTNLDKDK